jgi:predicted AAA+ superfamily ATPase
MEEFAADLYDVAARIGQRPLYEDPARFFSLTYATPALREIAAAVADRLRGKSAKGIRQLELSFGGGKTHTMVTLTHWYVTRPRCLDCLQYKSSRGAWAARLHAPAWRLCALTKSTRKKGALSLIPMTMSAPCSSPGASSPGS